MKAHLLWLFTLFLFGTLKSLAVHAVVPATAPSTSPPTAAATAETTARTVPTQQVQRLAQWHAYAGRLGGFDPAKSLP